MSLHVRHHVASEALSNLAPLEPDRGPPSGGGPPVGGKGILPDCGPLGDLLAYLNHVYFDGKLFNGGSAALGSRPPSRPRITPLGRTNAN